MKISGDQLLQPHKSRLGMCRLGDLSLAQTGDKRNQPGQRVWYFYTSEALCALVIPHDDGQIQTPARNMREWPAGVESQRRKNREYFSKKIRVQGRSFPLRE